MDNIGKICVDDTYFFCCDMQERFRANISQFKEITVVITRLLKAAKILNVPIITTEQYPRGKAIRLVKENITYVRLGNTIAELNIAEYLQHNDSLPVIQKTKFSMIVPEVDEKLNMSHRKTIVLFGIEAHVCILQTALDLRQKGYTVHVIADGISSRSKVDRLFAIERMRQSRIFITTYETVLLGLVGDSKNAKFKEIQKLILELPPDSNLF